MRRPASRHLVALGLALVLVQPTGAWAHGGSALSTLSAGASAVVGGTVVVSTVAAGWVLSAAGEALCFIPNELGRALLHDERLTW